MRLKLLRFLAMKNICCPRTCDNSLVASKQSIDRFLVARVTARHIYAVMLLQLHTNVTWTQQLGFLVDFDWAELEQAAWL